MAKAGGSRSEPGPYASRLTRLRAGLRIARVDHFLVTNPLDVGYLTGFLGGDSYLLLSARPGKPVLVSDFRYLEELEPLAASVQVVIRKRTMGEAIAELLSDRSVKRCGVQGETMTLAERDALARRIGESKLVTTAGLVGKLRARKDAHEVALIEAAVAIQEKAMRAVLPAIRPGRTEMQIAAELEAEMKALGSSQPSFETIVAARAKGSLPHYRPGKVKTAAGQPLLIDWGATYQGYHSDMTRTFSLGRWPAKVREIYGIVLEAHERAAAALAPGVSTTQVDAAARGHIAAAGYGERFGHGLGHGIGLNVHEDPRLSHMLPGGKLEPGHIVTIEPGIYLPGVGGVRIEDDYLITEKGARCLCRLPKSLEWCTLG
ncbi:MAG: aminopeptidase P family protein [Phycisphaerales bacterium]|nr:aminopeptidase P family protein [Phycisphaerales bacterium]